MTKANPISRYDDEPLYDIAPLLALFEDLDTAASVFGVTKRSVLRYQQLGVSWAKADELAVKAGVNPMTIWPEWSTNVLDVMNASDDAWYEDWLAGDRQLAVA